MVNEAELQRTSHRRRRSTRRMDNPDLPAVNAFQHFHQTRNVHHILHHISVSLQQHRKVRQSTRDRQQVLRPKPLQPERCPTTETYRRHQKRTRCILAERRTEHRRIQYAIQYVTLDDIRCHASHQANRRVTVTVRQPQHETIIINLRLRLNVPPSTQLLDSCH